MNGFNAMFAINGSDAMSAKGRKEIANWMRARAEDLENEGANYDAKFVAYWRPRSKRAESRISTYPS